MDKRIVYQMAGQSISVLIPGQCGLSLHEIGQKDVPPRVPFWIVNADEIPTDRTYRDAWELDPSRMGEPNGIGGTFEIQSEQQNDQNQY